MTSYYGNGTVVEDHAQSSHMLEITDYRFNLWMLEVISSFRYCCRFSSSGVLLGGVMVAFTEHPVVDVVLVVEDTSLGSTNIQVEKAWVQP